MLDSELTPAEDQALTLLRMVKAHGHGSLRVEVTKGVETQFIHELSTKPARTP